MAQRRSAARRLNSSCRPVTAATGGNQAEERATYVARLKAQIAAGAYMPTVDRLVLAMTGQDPGHRWV